MRAIIFNSGIGKRMGDLTKNTHKSLVKLTSNETILDRQIRVLSECSVESYIITTGSHDGKIKETCSKKMYRHLSFTFVHNNLYDTTNYIYSMYLAKDYFDDDLILLHGDLVFNKRLIIDMMSEFQKKQLDDGENSLCLINKSLPLPEKDFKGRLMDNILREVAIDIFDADCFAFQPLYMLSKFSAKCWIDEVDNFVQEGITGVYAENALNGIMEQQKIQVFRYDDYYIDEVDNPQDLTRVSQSIRQYDFIEQETLDGFSIEKLTVYLERNHITRPMVVTTGFFLRSKIKRMMDEANIEYVVYSAFTANPTHTQVLDGVKQFKINQCDAVMSVGGGSSIDVAKCIKLLAYQDNTVDLFRRDLVFSPIKHICVPTTCGTGSEATTFSVIYKNGDKKSIDHMCILPDCVIFEPSVLESLPDYHLYASILDAVCQAIESIWSVDSGKVNSLYAFEALELFISIKDLDSRSTAFLQDMQRVAYLAGKAINLSKTTAPHALSYKLTSMYGIAHGHAVSIVFPYVWAHLSNYAIQNDEKLNDLLNKVNSVLGVRNTKEAISLFNNICIGKYGLKNKVINDKSDIDKLVKSVNIERLNNHPVMLESTDIRNIYLNLAMTN